MDPLAMRLGLYGGTFDPIHLGHLILAEQCREACALDQVWLIVAGTPPHKPAARTSAQHRLEMARIAVAGHTKLVVSEIETNRPGPNFSVDTLRAIHQERPDDELFFLIGADSLVDLPGWREPSTVAELATIVVVNRPGLESLAPERFPDLGRNARPFLSVTIPPIGIASHDLRARLAEGRSIRSMVPRGVEAYIQAQGLYGLG
jgi:nicotinate-nucleotide adenylyltransferase